MRGALGGPRVLLRRLREVMAEPVSAKERLDKIVVLIAANMVAEVCSVYVLRVDGTLELYATEGLNRQAVHLTVMRADEGLVGLVAREAKSMNLSAAQSHSAFPTGPRPARRFTTPSWVSRCFGLGTPWACWLSKTGPIGPIRRRKKRRCRPPRWCLPR